LVILLSPAKAFAIVRAIQLVSRGTEAIYNEFLEIVLSRCGPRLLGLRPSNV